MCSIGPNHEIVTSVGNSWIICRSKSCAGRIYYFNTLTGDAVWNLSESEVKKAKKRMKILQSQPGFKMSDCPEPSESPKDILEEQQPLSQNRIINMNQFSQQVVQPKVYNKQIINNRFSKSPTQCTNNQFNLCNPINPIQLNVPLAPSLSPAVWTIAPQQIFVTPTLSQPQPFNRSNCDHVLDHNQAETLSNRFKKYSAQQKQTGINQGNKYKYYKRNYNNQKVKLKHYKKLDLRLLLSLKRRENILKQIESQHRTNSEQDGSNLLPSYQSRSYSFNAKDETGDEVEDTDNKLNVKTQKSFSTRRSYNFNNDKGDVDEMLFEHLTNKQNTEHGGINPLPSYCRSRNYSFNNDDGDGDGKFIECLTYKHNTEQCGTNPLPSYHSMNYSFNTKDEIEEDKWLDEENCKSQEEDLLEKEALRSHLHLTENRKVWYIVTDSNVLLYNIHLLNIVLDADAECRLIVPQTVMNNIRSATNSRPCLRILAHKALYCILKQVEANLAIIDDNSEEIANSNDDILNCCVRLIEKGNHVVILTDDIELHNNKKTPDIPILTVAEIKRLVKENKSDDIPTKNLDTIENGRNIKITIENESKMQHNEEIRVSPTGKYTPEMVLEVGYGKVLSNNNVKQIEKKVCDIGVQANSVALPKINDEIVLPDSTKVNDTVHFNIGAERRKRYTSHNLPSQSKYTGKKKIWYRHKMKSNISLGDCHPKERVLEPNCLVTDSTTNENAFSDVESISWPLYSNRSTESLNNDFYDESSESGSLTMFRNVNPNKNITVDETSNSGVSNSASERSAFQKENKEDNNVMFEVADGRMEEFLRMKCDEWVSRLVQVMEEALSQVLRLMPASALEHMPPPWTVHEAAECVKKFFSEDSDVVDAANKFLRISVENGGLRGKIKSSITPQKYMELYSYGVYLIDALQGVLTDNEDLQTAAESLSKLLNDIQDPHLDTSKQDSFNDVGKENEANVSEDKDTCEAKVNPDDKNKTETPKRNNKNQSTTTLPGKYNLRSHRKIAIETKSEDSDNTIVSRNSESESFFSHLHLMKISTSNNDISTEKSNPELETSNIIQEKCNSPRKDATGEHPNTTVENGNEFVNDESKVNETKIIRKFSICPKYEEKFKNNTKFSSDNNKEFEGSFANEEEYWADDYEYEDGDFFIDNDDAWYKHENNPEVAHNSSLEFSTNIDTKSTNEMVTFTQLMEKIETHFHEAYSSIQAFCVKCCKSLQSQDQSSVEKSQMQVRAEKTMLYIRQLCHKLNNMLSEADSEHSIFQILKRKEFKHIVVNHNDLEVYRHFIGNCLEQGNILMNSVTLVLEASKELAG